MTRGCWAVLLVGTVGCGARSEMTLPGAQGGAPGGTNVTSSTTGAGGMPPCTTLSALPEVRSFDAQPGFFGHVPRLVATSADGEQVTLVVRSEQDPIPIDASPMLTQVTFRPWQAWSSEPLGRELSLAAGNEFVTPHTAEDGLTLWAFASTFATGPTMLLFEGAPIEVDYPSNRVVLAFENRPSFVTGPTEEGTGLGYVSFAGGAEQANLAVMTSQALTPYLDYACTHTRQWMDAVVWQGSLVATVGRPLTPGCGAARARSIWCATASTSLPRAWQATGSAPPSSSCTCSREAMATRGSSGRRATRRRRAHWWQPRSPAMAR